MTTRSWESVAKERMEMAQTEQAQMGRAQSRAGGFGFVDVFLSVALVGAAALEVYQDRAGGSTNALGSMSKPKLDLELVEPHSRWLARIVWRDGKWRVIEGRYETRAGRSSARNPSAYLVWGPDQYQFTHQKAAISFAEKYLKSGEFTRAEYLTPAYRKAHLVGHE